MIDTRKAAVSVRLNMADIRKIKQLAERVGVHDSDVIRFAVKRMLTELAPLYDPETNGRGLVAVFVESGAELVRFFELDAARLDAIINQGAEESQRVDRSDITLLALTGGREQYAALLLNELRQREGGAAPTGEIFSSVRRYFYDKYLRRRFNEPLGPEDTGDTAVAGV